MRQHDDRNSKSSSKKRKEKSKKTPSKLFMDSCWPKVMISRNERICGSFEQIPKTTSSLSLKPDSSKLEESKEATCEIVELFCCDDNGINIDEEKSACLISSSTKFQGDTNVCLSCRDCVECQKQDRNAKVSQEFEGDRCLNDFSGNDFSYFECDNEVTVASNTVTSAKDEEEPIFVDLTTDEKSTWKQTILKRFSGDEDSEKTSDKNVMENVNYKSSGVELEPRIMIADSSSRLYRSETSSNIATALRDRGPCVIPIQPNRSLPIHPAPPPPTRSSRKDRSPLLKFSKVTSLDVVEVEPIKLITLAANSPINKKLNKDFTDWKQNEGNIFLNEIRDSPNYVEPEATGLGSIGGAKRKVDDKKCEKESKKRKRSHEADSSQPRDERSEDIVKEFTKNSGNVTTDRNGGMSQHGETWSERQCTTAVVASTTENTMERDKEMNNKVVPPLRLKKIARSEIDGHGNSDISTEFKHESNYRIVTDISPRLKSRSIPATITSSRSTEESEKYSNAEILLESPDSRDITERRSISKVDSCKLKYRRNNLKQKLRELREKVLELTKEMSNSSNANDSNPQRSTRLKQAMNRYEKQIENLSKLLNKLSAAIPNTGEVIDVNDKDESRSNNKSVLNNSYETKKKLVKNTSPVPSPEPPKLSPRSPLDYDPGKLPEEVRNSPPILPRVCLTLPSLDCSDEELQIPEERIWTTEESAKIPIDVNTCKNDINERNRQSFSDQGIAVPSISSSIIQESETSLVDIEIGKIDFDDNKQSISLNTSNADSRYGECDGREKGDMEENKIIEVLPSNCLKIRETEKVNCLVPPLTESETKEAIVNPVVDNTKVPTSVQNDESFESITSTTCGKRSSAAADVIQLPTNPYASTIARNNVVFARVTDDRNVQKVTSSSNQPITLNGTTAQVTLDKISSVPTTLHQEHKKIKKICTNEETRNDSIQGNNDNRIITEQFPTLGNWVARMSKKQASKSKSKGPATGTVFATPLENTNRISIPASEVQKAAVNNLNNTINNNVANIATQWNTDRWQRQHHQQRQQLLKQITVSANPSQPISGTPPLRPSICPPISMTQFYPNSYTIDPYNGAALSYHSTMCPYGTYPYHSRLHSGQPLTGYHLSTQDNLNPPLRPLQHIAKRFPPLQDPIRHFPAEIMKYPGSLSATSYPHSNSLDFDRLRSPSTGNNIGTTCLPPLLLSQPVPQPSPQPPPPTLSSTQHTLPRTPLVEYPTNNGQFTRNRMIPDVVAAAAAAAVVAAASFDRQHGPLTPYNRSDTDTVSTAGITNIIDGEVSRSLTSNKSNSGRELANQTQDINFNEENQLNSTRYQHLENVLFDRLTFVRSADNFAQTSSFIGNDSQAMTSSTASTVPPYTVSSMITSNAQSSKNSTNNDNRNCETPHLGKVNRSPNTMNNLACSNCGVIGSMFKCLGCETAFYCDEQCQARHWTVHVEKCPKKMPKLKKIT